MAYCRSPNECSCLLLLFMKNFIYILHDLKTIVTIQICLNFISCTRNKNKIICVEYLNNMKLKLRLCKTKHSE